MLHNFAIFLMANARRFCWAHLLSGEAHICKCVLAPFHASTHVLRLVNFPANRLGIFSAYVSIYTYMHTSAYVSIYMYTYIYVYAYIYMYIYIYIHTVDSKTVEKIII
jgi:hypothetical protein